MAGGRVLEFKDYIGGADNVITLELFPRSRKTFSYNFDTDVSAGAGWVFSADYQSILLDEVTYDRTTGDPNFTTTNVLGYFDNYTQVGSGNITTPSFGIVEFTIPENRYSDGVTTGYMYPNARQNVVMTVVSFQWTQGNGDKDMHRWAVIERWEPGVNLGDPTDINNPVTYTAITSS